MVSIMPPDPDSKTDPLRESVTSAILDAWRALVGNETYMQASERFADAVLRVLREEGAL